MVTVLYTYYINTKKNRETYKVTKLGIQYLKITINNWEGVKFSILVYDAVAQEIGPLDCTFLKQFQTWLTWQSFYTNFNYDAALNT